MRILFIGCVQSSEFFLNQLIANGYSPVGVITKKNSTVNSDFVDLMPICEKNQIPCLYVSNVNEEASVEFIRQCAPDIIYCFGWSQLIGSQILNIPPKGCVGFHPAKLPYNRGRHPLIWALALGLEETASSFFVMDEYADTGPIISQEIIPIAYEDTAATLYQKVLRVAGEQMISFTKDYICNAVQPKTSCEKGNAWRKRGVVDGEIDWRMSGRAIYNLVRALTRPYPGAHFMKNGVMIPVWKVEECPSSGLENIECGKILSVFSPTEFCVKVYDGVIRVVECEPVDLNEGDYLL